MLNNSISGPNPEGIPCTWRHLRLETAFCRQFDLEVSPSCPPAMSIGVSLSSLDGGNDQFQLWFHFSLVNLAKLPNILGSKTESCWIRLMYTGHAIFCPRRMYGLRKGSPNCRLRPNLNLYPVYCTHTRDGVLLPSHCRIYFFPAEKGSPSVFPFLPFFLSSAMHFRD